MTIHPDGTRTYRTCNNCPGVELTPTHIFSCPAMAAALQKIDIDPEQQLYTLKIENSAVIEICNTSYSRVQWKIRVVQLKINVFQFENIREKFAAPGEAEEGAGWETAAGWQPADQLYLVIAPVLSPDVETHAGTTGVLENVLEFLFKSGDISATTIHSKLQPVYGNEILDRSTIQRWIQRFQKGDFDLHDKERPGKPSTVTTDQNLALVEEIVKNNRTITTYQLMKKLSIFKRSIHKLLSYLGYRKLCSQ
ncbi:hypothetical protein LAZ67_21000526 [Cordylochernes scorpioides]|uniref:Mos1 transposase HTH domain-containing protein n=1 Tax=Cordylochernes scorpioides TaxID=51811 RepID=A0ABY6LLG0_9ARAC|nr:hypothetical protein LAZ67_21000526 [Cordylochernes scorpioides]